MPAIKAWKARMYLGRAFQDIYGQTASFDQLRCVQMGGDPAELPLHLICFDEIDALCRSRGSLSGDTSGVRDSVVNQVSR